MGACRGRGIRGYAQIQYGGLRKLRHAVSCAERPSGAACRGSRAGRLQLRLLDGRNQRNAVCQDQARGCCRPHSLCALDGKGIHRYVQRDRRNDGRKSDDEGVVQARLFVPRARVGEYDQDVFGMVRLSQQRGNKIHRPHRQGNGRVDNGGRQDALRRLGGRVRDDKDDADPQRTDGGRLFGEKGRGNRLADGG